MKHILWAIVVALCITAASVFAADPETAARVALSPAPSRLPTSESAPSTAPAILDLPKELVGASIEIGFSQDGEPEPHLLVVADIDVVKIFELHENDSASDRKAAKKPTTPPADSVSKVLSIDTFVKRFRQAVEANHFFTAKQARPKGRCKDTYVLRIKYDSRFRERRGCSNQNNDMFAAFAQNMYRDAFLVWKKSN